MKPAQSRRSALNRLALLAVGVPIAGSSTLGPLLDATPAQASTTGGRTISIGDFGAVADDSTDAGPAIRAAIAAVRARPSGAGAVWFPPGNYVTYSAIEVPRSIVLMGESPMACRLRYAGPSTSAFITFGSPGAITTYSGLRGLSLDATGRVDTAVLLHGPQEGSTIAESILAGGRRTAVEVRSEGITGGSNKFVIDRSWLWTTGDSGFAGVLLGPGSGPLTIRDTTMSGNDRTKAPPAGSAGVVAVRSLLTLDNVNVEYFESHTHLDRTGAELRGVTGFFNRFGVQTTKASGPDSLTIVNAVFDRVQNAVVDRGVGATLRSCRAYSNATDADGHTQILGTASGAMHSYAAGGSRARVGIGGKEQTLRFSVLRSGRWRDAATVDRIGRFGTAGSSFDGAHLRMGAYHLWIDRKGRLRVKRGAPRRDQDGAVVGR